MRSATVKRHNATLLKRLIRQAHESELSQGKSMPGTLSIHSSETVGTAAAGSLVGLVHEIHLGQLWRLSARQIWDIVRGEVPKTEAEHWKLNAAASRST